MMQMEYIYLKAQRSLTNRETWEILEQINKKAPVTTGEKYIKRNCDS